MRRIVELRQDGLSWYRLAVQLMLDRVVTRDGREWSVSRVRRAYDAEMRRRATSDV